MDFKLGFIGGGNMSTAIFKGILKSGAHSAANIWVSGPHIENLKHWSDSGANITTDNGAVFNTCDMVFLGVKVTKLNEAVMNISKTISVYGKEIVVVSMLAGITIEDLSKVFHQHKIPVSYIIRIMPNTPMTVGAGICLYAPSEKVTVEQCNILENLVKGAAVCERVPESYMDSLGALTACAPAFMYLVIEALADGAVMQGVPRGMAMQHAAHMMAGSAKMVLESGKHPGLLKDEVCSPGGSTICGISALENGKLRATIINALEASTIRNKLLGKNN